MEKFGVLCRRITSCSEEERLKMVTKGAMKLLPELEKATVRLNERVGTEINGASLLGVFIMNAATVDGRVTKEEYQAIYPLFERFFGEKLTFEQCSEILGRYRENNRDMNGLTDDMADIIGAISDSLKQEIVEVCLAICTVDGRLSLRERHWIKKLIA